MKKPDAAADGANIDPDYFDLIVQSVSLLSSIATLGMTWLDFKKKSIGAGQEWPGPSATQQVRDIRREFDNVFETLEGIFPTLQQAFERSNGHSIQAEPPRYGTARIFLTPAEWQKISPSLVRLGNAANMLRTYAINLQHSLAHHRPDGEEHIAFDLSFLDNGLNQILFETKTLGEAQSLLNIVRLRAEDFLGSAIKSLSGNRS